MIGGLGVGGTGSEAAAALSAVSESPYYPQAMEALEQGDVGKAHRLLSTGTPPGEFNSLYGELLKNAGGRYALPYKNYIDKLFDLNDLDVFDEDSGICTK